ncbi:MAG: divalent-cation tolerance protein CutA [bacterium]|jgi:periplasmic divalent cation tolerance protein|nr:divalent-cation tolerance protein CutA [bacterium]
MSQDAIVVFVTVANRTEAELIGQALVEKKLIACCNIIEPVFSIFHWQSKICRDNEVLLILKSVLDRFDLINEAVKKMHSYETPEIIALPIIAGSEDYLNWVRKETS